MRIYQLKLVLQGVSPMVWRRMLVRSDTTLAAPHRVVQLVMGWEDGHLQRFRIHGRDYGSTTLGTGTFAAILAALRDELVNLILTVGRNQDPADFGPQPTHVHIARYVPQTLILPRCDLVITHGGFNTTMAALDRGLPVVAIPLGADQFQNASRCAALGVGRVVGPEERTPEAIGAAVRAVLADPTYHANAVALREQLSALPGPEEGVRLLERLAREREPLVASRAIAG